MPALAEYGPLLPLFLTVQDIRGGIFAYVKQEDLCTICNIPIMS